MQRKPFRESLKIGCFSSLGDIFLTHTTATPAPPGPPGVSSVFPGSLHRTPRFGGGNWWWWWWSSGGSGDLGDHQKRRLLGPSAKRAAAWLLGLLARKSTRARFACRSPFHIMASQLFGLALDHLVGTSGLVCWWLVGYGDNGLCDYVV